MQFYNYTAKQSGYPHNSQVLQRTATAQVVGGVHRQPGTGRGQPKFLWGWLDVLLPESHSITEPITEQYNHIQVSIHSPLLHI